MYLVIYFQSKMCLQTYSDMMAVLFWSSVRKYGEQGAIVRVIFKALFNVQHIEQMTTPFNSLSVRMLP